MAEWKDGLPMAGRVLASAARMVFSMVAPPRCRFCRAPLFDHSHPYICHRCLASIPWIGQGACRGCGYPAGPHASHGDSCQRCRGRRLNLTAAAAVARYRGAVRSLVKAFKYAGETELAPSLAGLLAERLRQADFGPVDYILPVALHPARRRQRGFDQADLLCTQLSRFAGVPVGHGFLHRVRHTPPQAALRREARLRNMEGAFEVGSGVAGKSLILVDDVMTTGATMAACATACRLAGARRVYGLVFAR